MLKSLGTGVSTVSLMFMMVAGSSPARAQDTEVAIRSIRVLDTLPGMGNRDTDPDPGETFDLRVEIKNIGTTSVTGIAATLDSTVSGVNVTVSSNVFPNLQPLDHAFGTGDFQVSLDAAQVACSADLGLTLNLVTNEGSWSFPLDLNTGSSTPTLIERGVNPGNVAMPYGNIVYDSARHRIIAVDGGKTWEFDGIDWRRLPGSGGPGSTFNLVFDSVRNVVVAVAQNQPTREYDGTSWVLRDDVGNPDVSYGIGGMAFDSDRGVCVYFSGRNESGLTQKTFEYDGVAWTEIVTPDSPPGRREMAIAYDPDRQVVVLSGGYGDRVLDDTWEYDGSNWVEAVWAGTPGAHYRSSMAFNPVDGVCMLVVDADTWTYDGSSWQLAEAGSNIVYGYSGSTAWDERRGYMVMAQQNPRSDVAFWDGSTWSVIAGYRPSTESGNIYSPSEALYWTQVRGNTWSWNGVEFDSYPDQGPEGTVNHKMCFDPSRLEIVAVDASWTVWRLSNGSWFSETPVSTPPVDGWAGSSIVFDPAADRLIAYLAQLQQTWFYSDGRWEEIVTANAPSPRSSAALAWDPDNAQAVLYGGGNTTETWTFDGFDWVERSTTGSPPAIGTQNVLVHDPVGFDSTAHQSRLSLSWSYDVWDLDPLTWNWETRSFDGHLPIIAETLVVDPLRHGVAGFYGGLAIETRTECDGPFEAVPTPPVITGVTTGCANVGVTLSADPGFSSYLWSNGQAGMSTLARHSGTWRVEVVDSFGRWGDAEITLNLDSGPAPEITGPTVICVGSGPVQLDAGEGFTSYLWSTGETSRLISVEPAETTVYRVTVSNPAGCEGSDNHRVEATDPAVITHSPPASVIEGRNLELSADIDAGENATVVLVYRVTGESVFQSMPMSGALPGVVSATIPGERVLFPSLEYSIEVTEGPCLTIDGGPYVLSVITPSPDISYILENYCFEEGGCSIQIAGSGFIPDTEIFFGSTPAEEVFWRDEGQLFATAPAMALGSYEIVVSNRGDDFTYSDQAFDVTGHRSVDSTSPATLPAAAGGTVRITGPNIGQGDPFSPALSNPAGHFIGSIDWTVIDNDTVDVEIPKDLPIGLYFLHLYYPHGPEVRFPIVELVSDVAMDNTWQRCNITGGAPGRFIFAPSDPSIVYMQPADTNPHVGAFAYRSNDGGHSWAPLGRHGWRGYYSIPVSGLAVDPIDADHVFVIDFLHKISESFDGGEKWSSLDLNLPEFVDPIWIEADRDSGGNLWLWVGAHQGLWLLDEPDHRWRLRSPEGMDSLVSKLIVHPNDPSKVIAITGWRYGSDSGLWYSEDAGVTWAHRNTGLECQIENFEPRDRFLDASSPERIAISYECFAEGVPLAAMVSDDFGATWSTLSRSILSLEWKPGSNGQTIYGSAGGPFDPILKSVNGGISWEEISGSMHQARCRTFSIDPANPNRLLVGLIGTGVQETLDDGVTWTPRNDGFYALNITKVEPTSVPGTLYGAYSIGLYGGGVLKSTDGGVNWQLLATAPTINFLEASPHDDQLLFMGGDGIGIYRSTDGGVTWDRLDGVGVGTGGGGGGFPIGSYRAFEFHPQSADIIYTMIRNSGAPKLRRCESPLADLADMVVYDISPGLPEDLETSCMAVKPTNGDVLFVGTGGAGVWRSDDRGDSWIAANAGIETTGVSMIQAHPVDSQLLYATASGKVYSTTDDGLSWQLVVNESINAFAMNPLDSEHIIFNQGGGTVRSTHEPDWDGVIFETGFENQFPQILASVLDGEGRPTFFASDYFGLYRSRPSPIPPPEVTDAGETTDVLDRIDFSWTIPESAAGYAHFKMGIGTTPTNPDVVPMTKLESSGLDVPTSASFTGLSLEPGTTYYAMVRYVDRSSQWNEAGVSDGILAVEGYADLTVGDIDLIVSQPGTVDIVVDPGQAEVEEIQFTLGWDPVLVGFDQLSLGPAASDWTLTTGNETSSSIDVSITGGTALSAAGVILRLDLTALADGVSMLNPTGVIFDQGRVGPGTVSAGTCTIAPQPRLTIDPTFAGFCAVEGMPPGPQQEIQIGNSGAGEISWHAAAADSWVQLSAQSGTGNSILSIGADHGSLSAGGYTSSVTVEGDWALDSPQDISITLEVLTPPAIDGPNQICPGSTAQLNAPEGWASYLWSNGSTQPSILVSPDISTEYQVTVTSTAGCSATSPWHTVNVPERGDVDGDGDVDGADIDALLGGFFQHDTAGCFDVNADGGFDAEDLAAAIENFNFK